MEPAQKPDKPWFLDAAFVIPLSVFIGYFWALSQTMGEYTYFNIPYSFISLNPTTVLARSSLFLFIIASVLIFSLITPFIAVITDNYPRVGLYILACLIDLCLLWYISDEFKPEKILMLSIAVGLTVIVLVITAVCMPILIAKQKRAMQERQSNPLPTTQYWNYLAIFITLGAIAGGYYGLFHLGKSNAKTTDTFYLVKQSGGGKEDSELVFVGTYGDYLVGVPFHRDTKTFDSFVIWKMPQAENTRLTFTREKVGRLQPVEVKSAEAKP
jgi:hypothetical protein